MNLHPAKRLYDVVLKAITARHPRRGADPDDGSAAFWALIRRLSAALSRIHRVQRRLMAARGTGAMNGGVRDGFAVAVDTRCGESLLNSHVYLAQSGTERDTIALQWALSAPVAMRVLLATPQEQVGVNEQEPGPGGRAW
jgi:hypothetical protein